MKSLKKITALLLSVVMFFCVAVTAFADEPQKKLNYLVIGDSIAYGYGLKNHRTANYGQIVADTNGYSYTNLAYGGGETTDSLLYKVQNSYTMRYYIQHADIISISIGGNDYFLDENTDVDVKRIANIFLHAVLLRDPSLLDEIAQKATSNFETIMDEIHSLNPDAVVVAQTLYQAWYGILGNEWKLGTKRVNKMILDYKKNNPDNFEIADVAAAFYKHKDYVTADSIHPSAKGNLAIAKVVLKTLCDAGLGNQTEPVVTEEGIDYNIWLQMYDEPYKAKLIDFALRLATGRLSVKY